MFEPLLSVSFADSLPVLQRKGSDTLISTQEFIYIVIMLGSNQTYIYLTSSSDMGDSASKEIYNGK